MDDQSNNPYAAPQSELHIAPALPMATIYQPATVLSVEIPRGVQWAKVVNGADLFRLTIFIVGFGIVTFWGVVTVPITLAIAYAINARAMWLIRYPLQFCRSYFWLRIALVLQYGLGVLAIIFAVYTSYRMYNDNNQWKPEPFYLPFFVTPILLGMIETGALIFTIAAIHGFGKEYHIAQFQKYLKWDLILLLLLMISSAVLLSQLNYEIIQYGILVCCIIVFWVSFFGLLILVRFQIHHVMYYFQNTARQLISTDTNIMITPAGVQPGLRGDEMSFLYPQANQVTDSWHGPTIM